MGGALSRGRSGSLKEKERLSASVCVCVGGGEREESKIFNSEHII